MLIAQMTLTTMAVLFVAAFLGGALNSVAGGGSFLSFPSLILSGVPPINANATSTVALWPGTAASVTAYRAELAAHDRPLVILLSAVSLLGGVLGALLLLRTSQTTFARLLPYLLLLATVLFTFGGAFTGRMRKWLAAGERRSPGSVAFVSVVQMVIATYGGYFGGGIGIMMLAALSLLGLENIHEMNALKTLLATVINGIAVVTFIIAGIVAWPQAVVMLTGAILGGYGGAAYARKLDPRLVRYFVIAVGTAMTLYFFLRG